MQSNPTKAIMGGNSGLQWMRGVSSFRKFAVHTASRIADAASRIKIAQGSTAPKASGENMSRPASEYDIQLLCGNREGLRSICLAGKSGRGRGAVTAVPHASPQDDWQ